MKKYKSFLTLIILITSIAFFKCSSHEEEKEEENIENYSEKSLMSIFQINEDYESHRLRGKIKKLTVSTFSLNPIIINSKEKNELINSLYHKKLFVFDSLGRLTQEEYKIYETKKAQPPTKTFLKYTDSIKVDMYYKYDFNNPMEVEFVNFYINDEIYKQNIFLYKDTLIKKRFVINNQGKIIMKLEYEYDKNNNLLWIEAIRDDGTLGINKFTVQGNQSIWNQDFRLNNGLRWFNSLTPKKEKYGNFFYLKKHINKQGKNKDYKVTYQGWGDFKVREIEENSEKLKVILEDIIKSKKQEQIRILDNYGNCIKQVIFSNGKIVDIYKREIEYY